MPLLSNRRKVTLYHERFYQRKWFVYSIVFCLVSLLFGALGALIILRPYQARAAEFDLSQIGNLEVASIIYDRHGREVGRLFEDENRELVTLDDVPLHFIQALMSAEDSRFYRHSGVDFLGIARALYLNLKAGETTQGASTITQQLARNTFDLTERSIDRKLVEAFLAHRIEQHYTKPQILEHYLNTIFFGPGAYGIGSASRRYFGKDPRDLTIGESAVICGLIKSPVRLSPLRNPELSKNARNHVLNRMRIDGFITDEQFSQFTALPITTNPDPLVTRYPYAYEEIRMRLIDLFDDEFVERGGFHIFTTLDSDIQSAAETAVRVQLDRVEQMPEYQGQTMEQYLALVATAREQQQPIPPPEYLQGGALVIDNQTGGILAMVGGRNYAHSQFNNALRARRAAGTGFLPFIHATAFENGEYPGTKVLDEPIDNNRVMIGGLVGILGEWGAESRNYLHRMEQISAREALSGGKLAASFRLADRVGRGKIIQAARTAGFQINDEQARRPSTMLGQFEATLGDYCLAYSTFASGGERPQSLQLIRRVLDRYGREIHRAPDTVPRVRVFDPITAHQTWSVLRDTIERGTASRARPRDGLTQGEFAGQTSTAYGFTDNWFLGGSDKLTVGVWCGFSRPTPIFEGAFSSETILPAWVALMNHLATTWPPAPLPAPPGARRIEICTVSGLPATDHCYERVPDADGETRFIRSVRPEYIRPNTRIPHSCDKHFRDSDILAALGQRDDSTPQPEPTLTAIEAVRPEGPLLVGIDPYRAIIPAIHDPNQETADPAQPAIPVMRPRVVGEADTPGPPASLLSLPRPGPIPLLED